MQVWIQKHLPWLWVAQWTPFFSAQDMEGTVSLRTGQAIELPTFSIEHTQRIEIPTGKWTPPETFIIIPWHNQTWLDISKLNLGMNRG